MCKFLTAAKAHTSAKRHCMHRPADACISTASHIRAPSKTSHSYKGPNLSSQWLINRLPSLPLFHICTGAPITLGESQHISSLALISNPPPLITDPSLLAAANNTAAIQLPSDQASLLQHSQTLQLPSSTPSAMVSPGPGLPAISKKLYDAIHARSYVDIAQFPAAKGRSIPPTSLEGQIQASELVQT